MRESEVVQKRHRFTKTVQKRHSFTKGVQGVQKKITSIEMKCYRKILRISWTERKTNASVLEQLGVKAPQLLNLIKKQKLSYFGHIKRHNTLEKLFLEGTCEGRRGRGRPRRRWTQDIGEWMGFSTVEAGRQALERGEFRQEHRIRSIQNDQQAIRDSSVIFVAPYWRYLISCLKVQLAPLAQGADSEK